MITVTERAIKKIKALAIKEGKEGKEPVLRIGVKGGGCSGLNYFLDFVDEPRPDDQILECVGLKVLCDPKSLQYIDDMEVDFETNLMNAGFQFRNPHAQKTCSCGESFTI